MRYRRTGRIPAGPMSDRTDRPEPIERRIGDWDLNHLIVTPERQVRRTDDDEPPDEREGRDDDAQEGE